MQWEKKNGIYQTPDERFGIAPFRKGWLPTRLPFRGMKDALAGKPFRNFSHAQYVCELIAELENCRNPHYQ